MAKTTTLKFIYLKDRDHVNCIEILQSHAEPMDLKCAKCAKLVKQLSKEGIWAYKEASQFLKSTLRLPVLVDETSFTQ